MDKHNVEIYIVESTLRDVYCEKVYRGTGLQELKIFKALYWTFKTTKEKEINFPKAVRNMKEFPHSN